MESVYKIANYFIEKGKGIEGLITHTKLQKLVYISFGYYSSAMDEPLFDEDIYAYQYGPVIRDLYKKVSKRDDKQDTIVKCISDDIDFDSFTPETKEILDYVFESYSGMTASALSDSTHIEGSPWSECYQEGKEIKIDKEVIRKYFLKNYSMFDKEDIDSELKYIEGTKEYKDMVERLSK